MTFLDLLPGLKRTATTHGGEWAGPCPFCGGRDRFRAWPDQGPTGRYWCRGCHKSGDAIQFLRDKDGLTYRDACAALGVTPSLTGKPTRPTPTTWEPRQATTPGTAWADRAGAFLGTCQRNLAGPSTTEARASLIGRGLKPETIRAAGLGWNMADRYENRDAWGLDPEAREDGKPRRVWLPAGLVIPCFAGGRLVRLRVRRPDPGDGPRYVIISGSASSPLHLGGTGKHDRGTAWVIVESELDAILLWQVAGDLAGVIALGSAQARPDAGTDRTLRTAGLILVSLDSDGPGARESWQWWAKHYPNAKRWPIPIGKDPTEAKQAGLDLRAWVLAGLSGSFQGPERSEPFHEPEHTAAPSTVEPEPTTEPAQSAQAPHQEPLQSTQTKKTYQTRGNRFLPLKVLPLRPRATRKRLHRLGHTKTRGPNVAPFLSHFLPSGKHVSTKSS